GLVAVASALAAVFVALGPLIVKAVGSNPKFPTIGGTFLAALVSLAGTFGLITAVAWQAAELTTGNFELGVVLVGVGVGAVIWYYASKTLLGICRQGTTDDDGAALAERVAAGVEPPALDSSADAYREALRAVLQAQPSRGNSLL